MPTKVIGVAGRPGSGKSAVLDELAVQDGVEAIDLDRVAWETYAPGTTTYERLVERFGDGLLAASGRIDRSKLAAAALATPGDRDDLAAIVHPAVGEHLAERVTDAARRGVEILLVEGALLASSPYVDRTLFDAVLWLEVSEETRRARLRTQHREDHTVRMDGEVPVPSAIVIDAEGSVAEIAMRVQSVIEGIAGA